MSYDVRNDAHMRAANKYLDPFYGLIFLLAVLLSA